MFQLNSSSFGPVHLLDQTKLDSSLANISVWCTKWGMQINVTKTKCITITQKRQHLCFNYNLSGHTLVQTDSVKYLGVTFTKNLKWNVHVENISAKAFRQLGFLRRKLRAAPAKAKLTAYLTLVRPILEYASIVWNPHQAYLIDKLEHIQNMALRFIYSKYSRHESVTALRNQASIPTLINRRRVASLKFIYLLYHGKVNIDKEVYLRPPFHHSRRTNHSCPIRPFLPRNNTFKFSYFPLTIETWNNLPSEAVEAGSVDNFVAKIESLCNYECH